jgi:putative ABC transport system permease protein
VRANQPSITLGLRAARESGGAVAVLAGSTLAVATVAATLVFSASVVHFVDQPNRYGWPYDVAALVNAGYNNPNLDAIAATLDGDDSGVAGWGRAALSAGTQVNGSTVPLVGMRDGFEAVARTPVVSGRLPIAADEVALGKLTADELGVDVGDEVDVTSRYGDRTGTVTGFVVLPTVGPLESDRASLGTGLLLPPAFLDELMAGAAESLGMSGAAIADSLGSFVVIDLEDGVDPAAWLRAHEESMVAWDPFGTPPLAYTEPVRPSVVIDIEAMQSVPALLAAVLAAAMSVSVVAGVAAGTRARRRELAILRALGGSARQVRASVRWHALAVVATGLVLGLAPGVALGRTAYSAFARSIGAAADPRVPLGLLGVLVVAVLALGIAAAALPGRHAASHATVADALRAEAARTTG